MFGDVANFSGKLVVSAVLQSELSSMLSLLITWGLIAEAGLRYDGVGTQIQSAEGGLKHKGDPCSGMRC